MLLAVLCALALMGGAPAAAAQGPPPPAAQDFLLRPGDAVRLSVWRAPELDGEFSVLPNGTIAHPYLRDIVVAGLPIAQVQAALEERARTQNEGAQVMLQPLLRVVVGGEVSAPNLYRHPAGTTVAEALVLAGGASPEGDARRVTLVRDGQSSVVDVTNPNGPATSLMLASGDQLLVARRGRTFGERVTPIMSTLGAASGIALLIIRIRQ